MKKMKMNKMLLPMKKNSFLIALLIVCTAFGQNYKGTLSTIETDGLHKMMLSTDVRAASNDNFNFLRIKDSQAQEVPYVLLHSTSNRFSKFIPVKIQSKKRIKKKVTRIVIENKEKKKLENITLKIANTNIEKYYDVYGSNNGKDWFGLVEDNRLSFYNEKNSTVLEKTIGFPLNNYEFIRIDFNDKYSLPINVLEAGFYKSEVFSQEPIQIKDYTLTTTTLKDKKVTQLKFTANKAHKIDLISFDINTEFFLRNTKITVNRTRKYKKQIETYTTTLDTFILNSKNKNTFYVGNLNEKEFVIEIANKDNPALIIENIQLLQKPVCIVANLKKDKSYEMHLDTLLTKPSYDLGNFISNKTKNIKEATITSFSEIKRKQEASTTEKSFWQTTAFMWGCIILGAALVVYFAISLLKDIDSEKK